MPEKTALPRYRGKVPLGQPGEEENGVDLRRTYRGTAAYSEAKCQFVQLFIHTGSLATAKKLADDWVIWPEPGRPAEYVFDAWARQWQDGNYDPPAKIAMRFDERWNNAFKYAYRELGLAGVKTVKMLTEIMAKGPLEKPIELLYAKDAAWSGADGTRMLRETESPRSARMVGGVRIIAPVQQKQLQPPKSVSTKRQIRKNKVEAEAIAGEFRVVE